MARDHAKAVTHSLAHVRKIGTQGHQNLRASTCTAFEFATFSPPTSSQPASSPGGVSTLAPSAIMAFQAFGYVSGTFQPNMCAASGTSVSAVRSLLRSPARCSTAAMHSSRGPAACRSSGCIALHALQSSCTSSFFMLLPKRPPLHCFSFELHPHPLLPSPLPFLSTQPP
jgi:hypothetical protein